MKTRMNLILGAFTVVMSLFLANCGSNSGGGSSTTAFSIGATCGTNMIQSQFGCLPQCASNAVIYNGTCTAIAGGGWSSGTYTGYNGNAAVCTGGCGMSGMVQVSGQCLPQGTCGSCYGEYNNTCYPGDYISYYLGY